MTAILNFICFVLVELFDMAYAQFLNLYQINNEPRSNENLASLFCSLVYKYIKWWYRH